MHSQYTGSGCCSCFSWIVFFSFQSLFRHRNLGHVDLTQEKAAIQLAFLLLFQQLAADQHDYTVSLEKLPSTLMRHLIYLLRGSSEIVLQILQQC